MNKTTYAYMYKNIRNKIAKQQRADFDAQFAFREKKVSASLLLSLFLGSFGVDRFYIGQVGLGFLKLITFGGFGFWTLLDWFLIGGETRVKNITMANYLKKSINNTLGCHSREGGNPA